MPNPLKIVLLSEGQHTFVGTDQIPVAHLYRCERVRPQPRWAEGLEFG